MSSEGKPKKKRKTQHGSEDEDNFAISNGGYASPTPLEIFTQKLVTQGLDQHQDLCNQFQESSYGTPSPISSPSPDTLLPTISLTYSLDSDGTSESESESETEYSSNVSSSSSAYSSSSEDEDPNAIVNSNPPQCVIYINHTQRDVRAIPVTAFVNRKQIELICKSSLGDSHFTIFDEGLSAKGTPSIFWDIKHRFYDIYVRLVLNGKIKIRVSTQVYKTYKKNKKSALDLLRQMCDQNWVPYPNDLVFEDFISDHQEKRLSYKCQLSTSAHGFRLLPRAIQIGIIHLPNPTIFTGVGMIDASWNNKKC